MENKSVLVHGTTLGHRSFKPLTHLDHWSSALSLNAAAFSYTFTGALQLKMPKAVLGTSIITCITCSSKPAFIRKDVCLRHWKCQGQ